MSLLKKFINLFKTEKIEPDPMKYLIAGLGNMGADYDNTRHNIGFEVVNKLAKDFEVTFKNDQLGDLAQFKHKGRKFILLKPSTYMNRSGKALRYWMTKEKIQKQNLLVVVDDLNLNFGTQRLRVKGGDGGHNGLRDINQILGGNNYARLRIGIGRDFHKGQQVNFVLGEWSEEEKEKLSEVLDFASQTVLSFGTIGLVHTMNKFNKKLGN